MNRTRITVAAIVATAALAVNVPAPVGAMEAEPSGEQVLDLLCSSKGGTPYFTPYTIARCQTARDRQGFEIEQLICEGLLGGQFSSVPSPTRPNRANWACVSGAGAA